MTNQLATVLILYKLRNKIKVKIFVRFQMQNQINFRFKNKFATTSNQPLP